MGLPVSGFYRFACNLKTWSQINKEQDEKIYIKQTNMIKDVNRFQSPRGKIKV